ncbi:hypothetical protein [Nocardia altamirensis]|uniref:hypothetical protein n=1 Tax=Nocardia altamirensis TaxID=472158 RepID=UPI0008407775|nr:hypothetical protein [Nocardia altamirensis]
MSFQDARNPGRPLVVVAAEFSLHDLLPELDVVPVDTGLFGLAVEPLFGLADQYAARALVDPAVAAVEDVVVIADNATFERFLRPDSVEGVDIAATLELLHLEGWHGTIVAPLTSHTRWQGGLYVALPDSYEPGWYDLHGFHLRRSLIPGQ